ncbi:MAG: hypothetical protein H7A31_04480 [Thermotogae bacterium]|nr:hypothetical protein [Thermotogota bacterium]MCP5465935.1 hypothetical protein [Thermotogota bacterium]
MNSGFLIMYNLINKVWDIIIIIVLAIILFSDGIPTFALTFYDILLIIPIIMIFTGLVLGISGKDKIAGTLTLLGSLMFIMAQYIAIQSFYMAKAMIFVIIPGINHLIINKLKTK